MIYLVNRVCYKPQKFEKWLSIYGIHYRNTTEREWYGQLQNALQQQSINNNIWLHVWDDHPFMCGRDFQIALREKRILGTNDIFVVFNDSYRLRLWQQQLKKDIEEKFGYMFSIPDGTLDRDKLNEHIFIVNSETGENFDALILSIRHLEFELFY